MNAKMSPYETCPDFENERYLLRFAREEDAAPSGGRNAASGAEPGPSRPKNAGT